MKTPAKGWCNKLCVNLRGLTLHTKKVFCNIQSLQEGWISESGQQCCCLVTICISVSPLNTQILPINMFLLTTQKPQIRSPSFHETQPYSLRYPNIFWENHHVRRNGYIINHDQVCILYRISAQHDHNPTSNNKLKFQNRSTNNAFPNTASKAARTGRMSPEHAGQTKHHLHLLVPICLQICVFPSNHIPLTLPPAGSAIHSTTSSVSACGSLTHELSATFNLHHNTTKAHASNSPSMANNHILENHMFFFLQFAGIWIFLSCWSTNPPACTINFPHIAKIGWKMSKTPKPPGKTFFARTVSFFSGPSGSNHARFSNSICPYVCIKS